MQYTYTFTAIKLFLVGLNPKPFKMKALFLAQLP